MPYQETSKISYISILPELSTRQKECLIALKKIQPANNLMLSRFMGRPINQITGRIFELRHKKLPLVRLHHTGACPISHETTRFYCIVSYVKDLME
jgi:hypothetical protein